MLGVALLLSATVNCGRGSVPYFIPGSATLPSCSEPPAFNLDGSTWLDSGQVTIQTSGCLGASPGEVFNSCTLQWVMTQTGQDIEIIVDTEYRILGRLCGDVLHLEGGWWLPVEDQGQCTYADDSAAEVGIQMEGSTLVIMRNEPINAGTGFTATGTLQVRGPCDGSYDVTFNTFIPPTN